MLKTQPQTLQSERVQFGMTMFFANLISGLLVWHLGSKIYHSVGVGMVIGLFWFLFVWMIDRLYVQYIDKHGKDPNAKKVIRARKAMVLTFGILNASFVMLELFHTEVNQVIVKRVEHEKTYAINEEDSKINKLLAQQKEADQDYNQKLAAYENWEAKQQKSINDQRGTLIRNQEELDGEINGTSGSGIPGFSAIAREKKNHLQENAEELKQMQIDFDNSKHNSPLYLALEPAKKQHDDRTADVSALIMRQRYQKQEKVKEIGDLDHDGYLNQLTALFMDVAPSSPIAFFFIALIFAGFIYLEGFVVFSKAKTDQDSYQFDCVLEHQRHIIDSGNSHIDHVLKVMDESKLNYTQDEKNKVSQKLKDRLTAMLADQKIS